jgi:hypothetical protein
MAITFQDASSGQPTGFTSAPYVVVMNTACAIGDLIVLQMVCLNVNNTFSPSATDNVNTGSYTLYGVYFDATSNEFIAVMYKVANAAGTPTASIVVTAGGGSVGGGQIVGMRFNGFTSLLPTTDAGISSTPATGTGTAIAGTSFTTGYNPELLIGCVLSEGTTQSGGNWTTPSYTTFTGVHQAYYSISTSAVGTAEQLTATAAASAKWAAICAGFYNGVSPNSAPIAWWS